MRRRYRPCLPPLQMSSTIIRDPQPSNSCPRACRARRRPPCRARAAGGRRSSASHTDRTRRLGAHRPTIARASTFGTRSPAARRGLLRAFPRTCRRRCRAAPMRCATSSPRWPRGPRRSRAVGKTTPPGYPGDSRGYARDSSTGRRHHRLQFRHRRRPAARRRCATGIPGASRRSRPSRRRRVGRSPRPPRGDTRPPPPSSPPRRRPVRKIRRGAPAVAARRAARATATTP
mmetsp:Transcript_29327/g.70785  ORF Transcript_29327/g.70785 Transcript_29327/m.70785 type:complete len:231 (+) Transcript_29327:1484-2176(+)